MTTYLKEPCVQFWYKATNVFEWLDGVVAVVFGCLGAAPDIQMAGAKCGRGTSQEWVGAQSRGHRNTHSLPEDIGWCSTGMVRI